MKIAFAGSFAIRLAQAVGERLHGAHKIICGDETGILTQLHDADILVSMAFNQALADAAPRLTLVQVPGAGLDRIDLAQFRPGLMLANTFGHEAGIAEYIMGAMLSLTRSFNELDRRLRTGDWMSQWAIGTPSPPLWPELKGKTLGILGFGHIGEALARRAQVFDMKVCAIRREAQPSVPEGVMFIGGPERLDEVLQISDYLAVTLSLSPATRGLLDARRLALLKPGSYLINVARAEIINEQALYNSLANGRLAGAALDVWYHYPAGEGNTMPSSLPFQELRNVLMTPHISGWTQGMLEARVDLIVQNVSRIARGEAPLNLVALAC